MDLTQKVIENSPGAIITADTGQTYLLLFAIGEVTTIAFHKIHILSSATLCVGFHWVYIISTDVSSINNFFPQAMLIYVINYFVSLAFATSLGVAKIMIFIETFITED